MALSLQKGTSNLTQLDAQLNNAGSFFGLHLPYPAPSILKVKGSFRDEPVTAATDSQMEDLRSGEQRQRKSQEEYNFKSSAKRSYRFFILRDMWAMLLREMKVVDIENPLPLVQMPLITLEELKTHLREKFGVERSPCLMVNINEDNVSLCQREIEEFVAEIERTRILGISLGHDQETKMEVDHGENVLPISLTAFSGLILKFSNTSLLPEQLKGFLEDVGYAKIGSRSDLECKLLQGVGIRLRGWIHCGAVCRALLNNEASFHVEAQAKFLEWSGIVAAASRETVRDAALDKVWVPMATTLASAIYFGVKRGYPADKQMFPVIWEAIDLTRLKAPGDLEGLSPNPIENWMVGMPLESPSDGPKTVNTCKLIVRFRRMAADFAEVYDPAFDPEKAAQFPLELFTGAKEERLFLPTMQQLKSKRTQSLIQHLCLLCGKYQHSGGRNCPEFSDKQPVCIYPHDNIPGLPPHSTSCCPILHHYCRICLTRGHSHEVHESRLFSLRELRERYFRHAHLGVYTSIPYLVLTPDLSSKLVFQSNHWLTGYQNLTFRSDPVTRYQLGIDSKKCEEIAGTFLYDTKRANLIEIKMKLVERNADADDVRDFRPVPKCQNELRAANL